MDKADNLYLGKVYVDYSDAIKDTHGSINRTAEMQKSIMEGLNIQDGRLDEISGYQGNLSKLIFFAESKGITLDELIQLGEEYKTLSVPDYFAMKEQVTIVEELVQKGIK